MKAMVSIIMGSTSDMPVMKKAAEFLNEIEIPFEINALSAHRTPDKVADFALNARENGYSILIGAAGMAAHLAGALKAHSTLPVIGVPLPGGILDGLDSLLATLQMPKGVPVATMTVGKAGFINSAILCSEIFSINNSSIAEKLKEFKNNGAKI